jgi:hypothetical protein
LKVHIADMFWHGLCFMVVVINDARGNWGLKMPSSLSTLAIDDNEHKI